MALVKRPGLPVHVSLLIVAKPTRLDLFDRDDDGVTSGDGVPAHRAEGRFAFHVLEPPLLDEFAAGDTCVPCGHPSNDR